MQERGKRVLSISHSFEHKFFFLKTGEVIGERVKRARHTQVCSIENRGFIIIIIVRANFVLITRKEGGA